MHRFFSEVWYLLRTAYRDFGRDTGGVTAGAIAFYTALALVPIALLTLSITGHVLGRSAAARLQMETMLLKHTLEFLKKDYPYELKLLNVKIPEITEIPAIPFTEAKQLISKEFHREITDMEDFEPEEEKVSG
jgi:hypothetical protein